MLCFCFRIKWNIPKHFTYSDLTFYRHITWNVNRSSTFTLSSVFLSASQGHSWLLSWKASLILLLHRYTDTHLFSLAGHVCWFLILCSVWIGSVPEQESNLLFTYQSSSRSISSSFWSWLWSSWVIPLGAILASWHSYSHSINQGTCVSLFPGVFWVLLQEDWGNPVYWFPPTPPSQSRTLLIAVPVVLSKGIGSWTKFRNLVT